jgi:hypothetical protein
MQKALLGLGLNVGKYEILTIQGRQDTKGLEQLGHVVRKAISEKSR